MSHTLTPFPRFEMPEGIERWDDGPPYGRILLTLDHDPADGEVVRDIHTGQYFRITLGVACGAGCRCAAEAVWTDAPEEVADP